MNILNLFGGKTLEVKVIQREEDPRKVKPTNFIQWLKDNNFKLQVSKIFLKLIRYDCKEHYTVKLT